jgi:hypothetical protein
MSKNSLIGTNGLIGENGLTTELKNITINIVSWLMV